MNSVKAAVLVSLCLTNALYTVIRKESVKNESVSKGIGILIHNNLLTVGSSNFICGLFIVTGSDRRSGDHLRAHQAVRVCLVHLHQYREVR
jgi:hypothetical protein